MGNLVATCDYETGVVGWYGKYYFKLNGKWKMLRGVLNR